MIDATLRPLKDRALAPLASTPIVRLHPVAISVVGLLLTLGAAVAAWRGVPALSVALFLLGRLADGVDGLAARRGNRATDVGGLIDFFVDSIGYAAIPIGLAFWIDDEGTWIVTTLLLASFYINAVSLGYVSALMEKRALDAPDRTTAAVLPSGLVEGTETIIFFTFALAFPSAATATWWVMFIAVSVTAFERVRWAIGRLR